MSPKGLGWASPELPVGFMSGCDFCLGYARSGPDVWMPSILGPSANQASNSSSLLLGVIPSIQWLLLGRNDSQAAPRCVGVPAVQSGSGDFGRQINKMFRCRAFDKYFMGLGCRVGYCDRTASHRRGWKLGQGEVGFTSPRVTGTTTQDRFWRGVHSELLRARPKDSLPCPSHDGPAEEMGTTYHLSAGGSTSGQVD